MIFKRCFAFAIAVSCLAFSRPVQAIIIPTSAAIKVFSTANQSTIGFLQLTGAQDRYIVGSVTTEDIFTVNPSASAPYSFLDTNAPASHKQLAGLISPGVELLASNSNAAILGDAPVTTAAGSTPQSGGSVSIPGSEYETTIWSLSGVAGNLAMTPQWVNHDGSTPSDSIVWDPVGQVLYLTANPSAVILNHPGSQTVGFTFLGVVPEPSTFALLGLASLGLLVRRKFGAR